MNRIIRIAIFAGIVLRLSGAELPGDQRQWALEFRARLEQSGAEQPLEVAIHGEWISTISAVREGEYDAALQLADVRVKGDGSGRPPADAVEKLQRRLSRPFWATYASDGSLLAMHFYKDVSASDRNLLQMIAASSQLVCPESGRAVWTSLERDGAGTYLAIYNRVDPDAVLKRKLKYVDTDGPAERIRIAIDQSEARFSLDPSGRVASLAAIDRVRIGVPLGDSTQLGSVIEIRLSNPRLGRAPQLVGSLAPAHVGIETAPILTYKTDSPQARAERERVLLEGHDTESLLQQAFAKQDDPKLADRLAALFRRRPEAPAAAIDVLKQNGAQPKITHALASAGTPGSVDALALLARDRSLSDRLRVDSLTALMGISHPSAEAMRIPLTLLDDKDPQVASAARIVGGALASAGRAKLPAQADTIDAALIERYRKARDAPELVAVLAGMGNSEGPSLLPIFESALRDARVPVRGAAARGLRLASGPEVDRLLSAVILSDADPRVRAAGILAAGFRRTLGPAIVEALVRAATSDPLEYVRRDSITLLRKHRDESPRIAETLGNAAR